MGKQAGNHCLITMGGGQVSVPVKEEEEDQFDASGTGSIIASTESYLS